MGEWGWVEDLDANGAADALAAAGVAVIAAEAEQFCLIAHWADLHAPEFVEHALSILPGSERPVASGSVGGPQIDAFAP